MERNYTVTLTLPSKGNLEGIPETVRIAPMRLKDQQLLKGRGQFISKILRLIESCTNLESVQAKQLTLFDLYYLLLNIREVTYNDSTIVNRIRCDMCGKVFDEKIDLKDIPLKYLEKNDEPFMVEMSDGVILSFGYMRIKDQLQVESLLMGMGKVIDVELMQDAINLAVMVREIEGLKDCDAKDIIRIANYLNELPLGDINKIRKMLDEHVFGYDTRKIFQCKGCGNVFEADIDLAFGFFRSE